MTYNEIVKKAKQAASKMDVSGIKEHIAIQIDVKGEGEGAFYIEVSEGKICVEPYEYYDNDCKITASSEAVKAMMAGTLNVDESLGNGSVSVEGDGGKALVLVEAFKAIAEKKGSAKKTAVKKSTATKKEPVKKTQAKRTAKKAGDKK